ncbi:MAG: translocation/assembly module TamB domain-containing protein [Pseudomonadota bacterium]|nr:translocation/assembly module TamB domain-containing protein [Pseudomonadota bacterium]
MGTEGRAELPERPPAARRRRWRYVLAPVGLVGVALIVLQSELVSRLAARALERAVEAAIGEQVTIGRIEVDYVPLQVELQGVVVTHAPTGETIAAVRAIRVEPGLEGFVPFLRTLTIEAPRVALHLDAGGLRELQALLGRLPAAGSRPASQHFPWRELVIREGRFSLEAEGGRLEIDGIDAHPGDLPGTTDLRLGALDFSVGTIAQHAVDVSFPGLQFAPDRLIVPEIDIHFEALSLDGALAVVKGGATRGDVSASLDLGRLTGGRGVGEGYVEGQIDFDATLGGTTDAPEASGAVALTGLVIWRPGTTAMHATRIGDAHGPWVLVPGDPMALEVGPLDMAWGEGTLQVDARVEPATGILSGGVQAEGIRLARILQSAGVAPTPWADFRGDLETHVTGTIKPFRLDGPFEVNVGDFHVNDGPIDGPSDTLLAIAAGTVVGELMVDAHHLVLDGKVASGPSRGTARADVGFAAFGPLGVDVDFPLLDLSQLQPLGDAGLGGRASVHGWVGGRYDRPMSAQATLTVTDAVVLDLPLADQLTATLDSDLRRLHFTDIRARLGETDYQGDFEIAFTDPMFIDTQVYVGAGHIRDLAGIFVDVGPMDGIVSGTAVLSGEPFHLDGDISVELRDVDLYGEAFPSGHATAWMDDGEFTLDELVLARGEESVLARGSVARGFVMNMDVLSDGVAFERLDHVAPLGLPLTGSVTLTAQIGGTLSDPAPRGRLSATRTFYDGTGLADTSVDFSSKDGVLSWDGGILGDALRTRGTLGMWGEQPYEAEATFSRFPAHLFYPRAQDGSPVDARISGDLSLAGRFGDSPTPVDIEGRFDRVEARWDGHELSAPQPWVFAVHGTSMQVPRLRLVGNDGTELGFEGYTTGNGQLAFGGGGKVNLDFARAFVPELELAQGMAEVEVAIERDREGVPRVEIGAQLEGATLRSAYFPADFENVTATIEATSERYVIRDVTAEVGGGTFQSGESVIEADGWTPRRYQLEGELEDARVAYLDYLPPIVGDASLRFDGPVDDLLLSGTIDIDEMEFRERIDWEAMVISLREERLTGSAPVEGRRYFSLDLEVRADDTVRLRNNVADADASANLRIIGDTSRPGMVGEIIVDTRGEVYLHEREFEVTRGELRYVDPYTFDPDLDILLETDVRSHDQDYHVTYGVTGPFSDWRTNTASDPYLAQADVNALLLFGVTREELERYGGLGTALVAETGDLLLAQTAISRTNLFIIDRWNLVSGVSERGSSAVTSDLRLVAEKQVGEFDITVEKALGVNLGSDWYASVERRIAERLYATAYVATRQEGRSLPIGAAYGAEFKLKWELD